jgi:hypothetical protein
MKYSRPLTYVRGSVRSIAIAAMLLTTSATLFQTASLAAADPVKKPAASLDDELFQGLDDATTAPGLKPKPAAATEKPASSGSAPTTTQPQPKPAASPAKTTPPAATKSNPLDDELLKSLGGDDSAPTKKPESTQPAGQPAGGGAPESQPSNDPFERLTQQIRDAESRLRRVDSGDKTQELQRQIVDDLDKLIAQIEKEQQQQQNQSKSSQSQSKKPGSPQPQQQPSQPQQQPGSGEKDSENANDSQDGTRNSTARKPDPGRMRSLLEKAWGSLPERERQDVMQSSVDDFPTKYQFVIEEYFKTLLRREE